MKTFIIQSKEESKTHLVLSLLKQLKIKARLLSEEQLEDAYLARLIDEGMAEKGEIPLNELRKKLRK
ncbi:MAG: hypothetical protein ABI855_08790 [Bacteroidota bacterium]